jgi:TonB family protein
MTNTKEIEIMERKQSRKPYSGKLSRVIRGYRILSVGSLLLLSMIWVSIATAQEYEASDVDTPPKIVRQMPITYPTLAKRAGQEGRVVIRVLIGTKGKADKMEVVESEPEGIFDEAALKSLKYWQFRPGIKDGELVATWVKIPLTFKLD